MDPEQTRGLMRPDPNLAPLDPATWAAGKRRIVARGLRALAASLDAPDLKAVANRIEGVPTTQRG